MKSKIFKFIKKLFTVDNKLPEESKKYTLALLIFFAATIMCFVPPVVSALVLKVTPLIVITGSEWVSVISMIGAFYFAANVVQKQIQKGTELTITQKNTKDAKQVIMTNTTNPSE
jgi:hypothetical protein